MQIQVIRKIGNSEGIIIPKAFLESLGLELGNTVDLEVMNGQLVLKPARRKYTLEELVAQMSPENEAPEISVGQALGAEVVEYHQEKEVPHEKRNNSK